MRIAILSCLCASLAGFSGAYASEATPDPRPVVTVNGKVVSFQWQHLTWRIPKDAFDGFFLYTNNDREFSVHLGYDLSRTAITDARINRNDVFITAHIRKTDNEDPKTALLTIHRAKLRFGRVPLFDAASFPGMSYIGSSSSFHYFKLSNEDADVVCRLVVADRLRPPAVSPDVLGKAFQCSTAIALPSGLYAWIIADSVHLHEAAKVLVAAQEKVASFML
ncbi:hypothetical protein [Dyella acidiphila]|uniref:Uncharacterized protein n=1 Tax=Dyella acidiphila TaxID=2775866 RepID=A0ABR9GE84_9GAMM|nr:hypothetical protein [Dyella acidiphila]MBE1162357.1 hypothetical protein [Dyella acidiphila]